VSTGVATPTPSSARIGAIAAEYVKLTKPRVISLLLVTTAAAMFTAAHGVPNGWLILWTMVGGYLAAGGANAINHYVDRDIDGHMKRTDARPVVAGSVTPRRALVFGLVLGTISAAILAWAANELAAVLAVMGLAVYVGIYTLWLKRSTVHNIVIGGAAGAFPPLVGWAAVDGHIGLYAWLMFAVVFYWTPPHFWALALLLQNDYAAAGVPMLPVVHGEDATRRQIFLWTLVMVGVTVLPCAAGLAGWTYFIGVLGLNAVFVVCAFRLWRSPSRRYAKLTFHYSLLYLALVFVLMAIDAA
jgi:protoheme IX farnesyltransferase